MSGQKSKQNVPTASMNTITTTTPSFGAIHPRQRITRNFLLIWIDANIDQSKQYYQNTLAQLRSVVNDVNIFTQRDEGIDFLTEVDDIKAFLIVEDSIGQHIVPLIHDIPQLDAIYIVCSNKSQPEQWTKDWIKIKGVHTESKPIYEALQVAAKQYNQDSIAVSFFTVDEGTSKANLNQLEPSFMYTQIFKEILLEMKYSEQSFKDFILFWRQHYINNILTLNTIDEFERDYSPQSSIRWYTREYFVYQMLNQALRTLEADTIINMGFFIRDLHQQIEQLHQKQVNNYHGKSFTVYRGQGLLKTDFEKLLKSRNGLMSFNNFLSTSKKQEISLVFAEGALTNTNMVGILFKMTINPSVSSAPFASIREVSYFQTEEEILFSMHTVFRIGEITKIGNNSSLYQVNLKLTADDDQELRTLTDHIREEVVGETGWQRLGQLLIKLSHFDNAEKLYTVLLEQTSEERDKANYYHQLGHVKHRQGDYEKAIDYYEKVHEIWEKTLPPNHPTLATSYNNIGNVYDAMGEYSKALLSHEKALEIQQKSLSPNHPNLATSYNNIGLAYDSMGEHSKALSFYEKDLEILKTTLPPNHPSLATSYNNIGFMYHNMGEYLKALAFYEKAFEIRQKTLPPNHSDFAQTYNNSGNVYNKTGEYSKALSLYEKALEILQKTLPPNHPDLAGSYNNVGLVYTKMRDYSKALSFYRKSLEIIQKTLPPNHPNLATSYNNIGDVYDSMRDYSKALLSHEKALEIQQKTLPPNHPNLTASYNKIGSVYYEIGDYPKALPFFEKALEIQQKTLPPNHPNLTASYNKIGSVYYEIGDYPKALPFFEKALEIQQKTLPPNYRNLTASYNKIGNVYYEIGDYLKALSFYEKALEINKKSLHPNHSDLATSYNNIAKIYYNKGDYSKALSYLERALDVYQRSPHPDHLEIQNVRQGIEIVKKKL